MVTKAWGYYILSGALRISSTGKEYSPIINYPPVRTSGAWYKLRTEVKGTNVKIYVNDKLAQEITMSGSGADAKSNNYVGLWCHNRYPGKGDSFQGSLSEKGHVL